MGNRGAGHDCRREEVIIVEQSRPWLNRGESKGQTDSLIYESRKKCLTNEGSAALKDSLTVASSSLSDSILINLVNINIILL